MQVKLLSGSLFKQSQEKAKSETPRKHRQTPKFILLLHLLVSKDYKIHRKVLLQELKLNERKDDRRRGTIKVS